MSTSCRSLKNKRDQKYDQKRSYQRQIDDIEEQLRRLRAAKANVSDVKCNVSPIANKTRDSFNELINWKGNEYNGVKSLVNDQMYNNTITYRNNVDCVLDRLCNEITRLENKLSETEGLLGAVKRAINNLTNEIEKFFN